MRLSRGAAVAACAASAALGAGMLLARRSLLVVEVRGASMEPTYADGDRLLAVRSPGRGWRSRHAAGPPSRGTVVVVEAPAGPHDPDQPRAGVPDTFVKRLVGVEGDPGVPAGMIVVEGDHPSSYDSRAYGPLSSSALLARVLFRFGRTTP